MKILGNPVATPLNPALSQGGVGGVGKVFDHYPTEAEIQTLPNDSFFTVKAYGSVDAETKMATYYKTGGWRRNALVYTVAGSTFYVVPVDQAVNEVFLPYYGIKTGPDNAAQNSEIMAYLAANAQYGATFRFPSGHFYFSEPIDVSAKHISILGTANAGYRHINISGTTFLHFPTLEDGEAAIKVQHCTIADFTVYGSEDQYHMACQRNNAFTDVNTVVQETANVRAYGIKASAGMIIRDIGVRNFYYGIWCDTANMAISNTAFNHCHYGLSIGNDIKVFNISGFNVMVLLQMRGSLSSATGVRGDSVGNHLVEILGGGSLTLADLDADFCMNAIVAIGDGINACTVSNLSITGVHGRSGVSHFYTSNDEEITANNITAETAAEYGVLAVKEGSSLNGAIIITNQNPSGNNPFDGTSGNCVPFVLFSAGAGTVAKGVQFISTSYTGGEVTEDWARGRVASVSALPDACDVKVQTNSGSIKYTRTNGAVVVTDDVTDIYKRMDKSALAKDVEVVKSVNGIQPDFYGNVEITEQEPEEVKSLEEMVDQSKRYVYDGYVYAYRKRFVPGAITPNFTNQLPISLDPVTRSGVLDGVGYKHDVRYVKNAEGQIVEEAYSYAGFKYYSTGAIPVKNGDVIRINAIGYHTGAGSGDSFSWFLRDDLSNGTGFYHENLATIVAGGGKYTTSGEFGKGVLSDVEIHINDETFGWITQYGNVGWANFRILASTPPDEVIITVNEEITYTVTEDRYVWAWEKIRVYDTPDYLGMIEALEERIAALENK